MKRNISIFSVIFSIFITFLSSCNSYNNSSMVKFELVKYGVFINDENIIKIREKSDNSVTGSQLNYSGVLGIKENTDKIKIGIGIDFGIEFSIYGIEDPKKENVLIIIKHPLMVNQKDNKRSTEYSFEMSLEGFDGNQVGWLIERDWEAVKGEWTFEVYYHGKKVINKKMITY